MQQLDIFDDSAERMRINDLAAALGRDDIRAAQAAAELLAAEFPDNPHRPAATLLIDALAAAPAERALPDLRSACAARLHLENQLAPAARELLGAADAAPWLQRRWRVLAQGAQGLPFDRENGPGHAAALWLQAGAWAEAADAVQRIESWRRLPQALAWMAEARFHDAGLDSCWPLLAELCWLAPARVPALLQALAEPRLHRWAQRFEREFDADLDAEPDAAAWLPAWLAVDQPLLAEPLSLAQAVGEGSPERSFRVVSGLIRLERQGRHHEVVAQRKQLRDLQPVLFALYMKTR